MTITAIILIRNENRTEWSSIRSMIIRVITKSDDSTVFVYHEYDYRFGRHKVSLIIIVTISEKGRIAKL